MASTDAANQAILSRISGMTSHHPAQANLFSDWTLEPGDIVTVSSDGTDYSVPVFSMDFTWRGDRKESEVSISATGGQKRDPPSALRRRSYMAARTSIDTEKAAADAEEAKARASLVTTKSQSGDYSVSASSLVNAINGQDTSGLLTTAKIQVGTGASAETLTKKLTDIDASILSINGDITDLVKEASDSVTGFGTATESGGQVSIPYYTNGSPSPTAAGNITFNLTTMKYYQDAIVVSVSQSWATVESSQIGSSNILRTYATSAGGGSASPSKTLTLTQDGNVVNMRDGGSSGDIRAKISVSGGGIVVNDIQLSGANNGLSSKDYQDYLNDGAVECFTSSSVRPRNGNYCTFVITVKGVTKRYLFKCYGAS